jgi:hypothetical protein
MMQQGFQFVYSFGKASCLIMTFIVKMKSVSRREILPQWRVPKKMWAFSVFSSWKNSSCCSVSGEMLVTKEMLEYLQRI